MGVVLDAPDRVNISCLIHDNRFYQIDVKDDMKLHGSK